METSSDPPQIDNRVEVQDLFRRLKDNLSILEGLFQKSQGHWEYDDSVYRFYHQSFKVFYVQERTLEIVRQLHDLSPKRELNAWFSRIVEEGTGKQFTSADNKRWLDVTRPILEAYFHARFFLEMAVKSGRELEQPPNMMPSGWAALLYLYGLR